MIRSYQALLNRILLLLDSGMTALAFFLSWYIEYQSGWFDSTDAIGGQTYTILGIVMILVFLITNTIYGLYVPQRTRRLRFEFSQIAKSSFTAVLVFMSILFFIKQIHVSRVLLVTFMILAFLFLAVERMCLRLFLRRLRSKGYNKKFVLIIGAGPLGRKVLQVMREHRTFGFEVIGFLDDRLYPTTSYVDHVQVMGTIDDLSTILNDHLIDQVILALPLDAHHKLGQIIAICEKLGIQTMIIPDFFNYLPARPHFEEVGGLPMIDVRHIPLDEAFNAGLKRAFDIVFSLVVLTILSPLFLFIAIGIKLTSPGPVLFVQERVGKNRRIFKMYKFRTMKVSSESVSDTYWTTPNDPRKTKFGTFLRKTSLDELPQFFNVLKGDMSIIGPRPERPYFVEQFKEDVPKYMLKHRVRPGITGWAQVNGWRGDTSIEERIRCDIDYIENWTFGLDMKIVIKTVINGFINKNAY
ncbi:undecaprenyl-phosphate glucose phosphotransferase [Collibacillus ludicampi]|uniref:Undecaprenyl-phosphate glucose phosphotransferase n=1 Tax=Collibacillus ludicampi TaxID=2771369 RepID=A0AAV4LD53_9BACL|nr:undecaprenyl-phosphate glucose phosphotransferase [Collibacillus ludicampi]GIM45656.1 undecaprenyl-phosphate glucose phosphotransferase [Collibacillus ludicampi]